MNLIKQRTRPFSGGGMPPGHAFAAVLEPKAGCSPAQVEGAARAASASQLEWLSPTMLSVVIDRDAVESLSSVAKITPKRVKQLH